MLKALALKELRELAPIAGLALCVYALVVARATGVEFLLFQFWPRSYNEVPFVTDGFTEFIVLVSACLAVALAVRQTIGESRRATWHWLLHRPLTRKQVMFVKLATGEPSISFAARCRFFGMPAGPRCRESILARFFGR